MEFLNPSSLCLMAALLFLLLHKQVEAIECYVCSWAPEDKIVEEDRCSSDHFDENRVRTISCSVGCEVVKMMDVNGELAMFYRNCIMATLNKLPYEYNKLSSRLIEEETFACDSDYCNKAKFTNATWTALFVPILALLFGRLW